MHWTRRTFIGRGLAALVASVAAPRTSDAQPPPAPSAARGAVVLCSRGERWGRKVNGPPGPSSPAAATRWRP